MRSTLFFLTSCASLAISATPAAAQAVTDASVTMLASYDGFDLANMDDQTSKPAGHQQVSESAPKSEASVLEVSTNHTIKTGRPFNKQGIVLTKNLTVENSVNVSYGCANANVWYAETGHPAEWEVDLTASCGIEVGSGFSVEGQVAYYFLPGRDAVQAMLTGSYDFSKKCSIGASLEIIRGGFVDNTKSVQSSCEDVSLGRKIKGDGTVMVAHSTNTGFVTPSISLGVATPISKSMNLRFGIDAFANSKHADVTFSLSLGIKL